MCVAWFAFLVGSLVGCKERVGLILGEVKRKKGFFAPNFLETSLLFFFDPFYQGKSTSGILIR